MFFRDKLRAINQKEPVRPSRRPKTGC